MRDAPIAPRWRKVARDLRLHRSRTMLAVVAIIVGLAGAGSVLDTWSLMRQVTREEYRASNPPSATLRVDSLGPALVARVRAMSAVAAAQARRTVAGSVRAPGEPEPRSLVLFALDDFRSGRIGKVKGEEGDWPPRDGALVIERSSVDFAAVRMGDTLSVRIGDAEFTPLAITGVARDVGLAPGWMEHVVYAFASPATLATLGVPPTFDELQIVVRDGTLDREGIRRVVVEVARELEAAGGVVTNVDVPVPGRHIHAAQIDSLLFTQGAFGAIALLLSGILVVNLVQAMLTGQVREIGVMKAIGATPAQVAAMYLALAGVLGLAASAVAIPAAAVIGRAYGDFTANLLNFSTEGFAIPRAAYVLQLAVGVLFPVAAAAIPVSRGCRVTVGEALRDVGLTARGGGGRATPLSARLGGVARPLLLSLRNAFRKRQRMVLTLLTLAAGGATFMATQNLKRSVRGAVALLFEMQQYDLVLRMARSSPADSLERAALGVAGVARAEGWGAARATIGRDDGEGGAGVAGHALGNSFSVSAVPASTRMLRPEVVDGRWLRDGDSHALVVNRRLLADDSSLTVGATVSLTIAGRAIPWYVVGVVEGGLSPVAYAPRATVASLTNGGEVDRLVVAAELSGAASQLELMQRLRTELGRQGFTVQTGQIMAESHKVTEDHLLMVADFLGVMGALMIVVGGLALASTMGLAVLERTREIGVLRAIGARHGAIMTMVQVEGLVIAILGWALAIPLSLPMSVVIGRAFGRIMLPLPITYIPAAVGVAQWLAVVLLVSVAACAWPAWRATRITTRAALAYE